ncbi:MAG: exopolysaccharide biosynthesis protein [Alphaproteobacteria bacterium]|nr:exopolysaccharide biosynthesis protein [Alphaproteobacteria bacterium]
MTSPGPLHPKGSVSAALLRLKTSHKEAHVSVQAILDSMQEASFALLLMLVAAPMALPLPALGIAQVFSVPLLLLSAQLAYGRHTPWLPDWLGQKTVTRERLVQVIDGLVPYLEKLERMIRPRLRGCSSVLGIRLFGAFCSLCSISVAIPLPFTNTVPSIGIVLICAGLMERDGLVMLSGVVVGCAGLMITTAVILLGTEAIQAVFF